ncbi:hypothetical protein [Enterovibrio calviensis]|uniref:hypothetical protein n=1 Tax=Enterovibrio calviensis TaxID=91359 RepID=UPI00047F17ED|nr:hypothetical protein [Enterovibrio calviensis]
MVLEQDSNSEEHERLKDLVLEGARLLREGIPEDVVLAELQRGVIHPKSAKLLLNKAKYVANNRSLEILPEELEESLDFHKVIRKWEEGCRPLEKCILGSFENDGFLKNLIQIREGLSLHDKEREEKLVKAGLPTEVVIRKFPANLTDAPQLTLPEKLGIKQVAMTTYLGLMEGQSKEEVAIRLAYVLDLELDATYRLVKYISLHTKPELRKIEKPKNKGAAIMMFALAVPFSIAMLIKSVAKTIPIEAIGVLAAVVALLSFPLFRRYIGEKTIEYRRENAPDGLISLAHDERAPILYLRSHIVDGAGKDPNGYISHFLNSTDMKTTEEKLSQVFDVEGPLIALEGPSEGLPNLGASRVRIEDVEKLKWQELVLGLIARAALVVVRFRPTQGARWEVEQLLRLCPPHQLVFILTSPEDTAEERETSWRELHMLLETHVRTGLPTTLGKDDYCLGFNTEFQPRIFSGKSTFFGKQSAFLDAVVEASAFSNPLFDKHKAKMQAASIF